MKMFFLKMFLGFVYWFSGLVLAVLLSCALGFALCSVVGLLNIFRYKWAWLLVIVYGVFSCVCIALIQLILFLAGTLGDHTGYKMQFLVVVGLLVPGIIMLAVIPQFIKVAMRQTRGVFT